MAGKVDVMYDDETNDGSHSLVDWIAFGIAGLLIIGLVAVSVLVFR